MSQLSFYLFGSPRLEREGKTIKISLRKALALLAYLAVTQQSHSRDALATLFWPDDDQSKARGNLRRTLSRLNRALGKGWLEIDRENAGLSPRANLWLDVDQFQRRLARCQTHGHTSADVCPDCLPKLAEAAELYADDFMAGFSLPDCPDFDEWQFFQSEGLRQALASALERLVRGYSEQGSYDGAIPHARRWLALDPLHEPAQRQLMELYAQTGQQAAAVRQYEECVRLLDEELGVLPSEETTALFELIRAKRVPPQPSQATKKAAPPARSTSPPHNLPPQPTPFIGRETELAALDDLIANSGARLVTIVGPGGMGKTRLALALAERQLKTNRFPNGVYLVNLAPLTSGEHIIPTVAEALNFPLASGDQQTRTPRQQILDYMRQKQMLMVMDNFEHLLTPPISPPHEGGIKGGVEFVADILQTAPKVQILATSRERLHLHEEQLYPIQGLEFPDWETAADTIQPEDTAEYTAVKLFLQSARRVRPDFEVVAADLTDLIRICRLVEGMPLGVELAAAWVDLLSLTDIAAEIQKSLDFLAADVINMPERHRSMRAVFDASWQQMSETEREVFPQLSVFRGGFTRQAAQDVTGASLRLLGTLVSKSLLQYNKARDRYQIHELLRQYGADKLAEQISDVRDRHSAYYCAGLQQREADLKGARQQGVLAEIEADIENVRAAWDWAVAQGQVDRLGQALDSLGYFYEWRGRFQEGGTAFRLAAEKLGAMESGDEQPAVLAKVMAWQGVFCKFLGQPDLAKQLLVKGLEVLDDPGLANQDAQLRRAFILLTMVEIAHNTGDRQEARQLLEQSLAFYEALDDRWGQANVLQELSTATWHLGGYDKARQLAEESLALRKGLGDQRGIAKSLGRLGMIVMYQGQIEASRQFLHESIALHRELGDLESVATATSNLGATYELSGEFAQAREFTEQSILICQDMGVRHSGLAHDFNKVGHATVNLGSYQEARPHVQAGLMLAREIDDQRNTALALLIEGQIWLAEAAYGEAHQRLEESVTIYRAIGQQGELIGAFSILSLAEHGLGHISEAEQRLREALRIAVEFRVVVQWLEFVLPVTAYLMASRGEQEQAVKLYALASRYPYIANSRWFKDVVGQHITTAAANLPSEVVEAAKARGQALDFWETMAEVLERLSRPGWGPAVANNLPPQPTPFIGREEELAEITQRMADPDCRLLTLVGAGGIGKTRLAVEAAERLLPDGAFPGGIYFVPLAALSSADFLVSTLAEALKFSFQGGADPQVQLLDFLADLKQAILLVLDNFEQLVVGADLLAAILQRASAVKLLVTSRERLNLRDEWLFDIRGLPFPETNRDQTSKVSKTFEVSRGNYSALQLFEQRAQQVQASFDVMTEYPAVVRICQLVAGMPLGLELAAAWVRVLSCQEIAQEIEKNLEFLATSLRDVPARHRSLIAVFDHSWNHLSTEEQRAFGSLAVFRGGFSREAAEQVADASLLLLSALVDKSMLRRNDSGRYELHELLRQYGGEKSEETGETERLRDRHLAFFLKLVEEAEPHLEGSDQITWLNQLEIEHDNLRAALDWSRTAEGKAEFGLRLAGSLAPFWLYRSHFYEGREHLSAVLSRPEALERTAARAKALNKAGHLAFMQTDYPAARPLLEESLSIYRELGPTGRRGLVNTLIRLGDLETEVGDYALSSALMKEALDIARELEDIRDIARVLWQLGLCAVRSGNYEQAVQYLEDALLLCRQLGDKLYMTIVLSILAEVRVRQGDYGLATTLEEESLALRREAGNNWGIAVSLGNFAWIALRRGDLKQAVTLLGESLILRRQIGDTGGIAWCLEKLAEIAMTKGQRETSSRRKEDFRRAARLCGAAESLRAPIGSAIDLLDQPEYERQVAAVRDHLGEATFAAAWAEGRQWTMEQVVQDALATEVDQSGVDEDSIS